MAELHYSAITSLDGFVADEDGNFDWAVPDEQVHAFVNDLVRDAGTYLYGRRMYDLMTYWETAADAAGAHRVEVDFARIWTAADKVVYSRGLTEPSTARTRVEREFDPDQVRELKAAAGSPLLIGGAELAGLALAAGLVEELQWLVVPYIAGGGKASLPHGVRLRLDLTEQRRFDNGMVFLRYRVIG